MLNSLHFQKQKGDEVHQETYKLLESMQEINFIGNIEGKEILDGDVDVVVTDGFTGNVALKTIEGVAKVLVKSLKDGFMSSILIVHNHDFLIYFHLHMRDV